MNQDLADYYYRKAMQNTIDGNEIYPSGYTEQIVWDIETVKDILPDVPVKLKDGNIVYCQIGGRKLKFAGIWLPDGGMIEVAWKTIVNVLNNDRAILI